MARKNATKYPFRRLGMVLIISGTLFVSVSSLHNLIRFRSLSLDRATVQAYLDQPQPEVAADPSLRYPTDISIKWFVDTGVEPAVYRNSHWTISENQASFLVSSAMPGDPGNIIIYGHNTRGILGNIRALKGGETVTLTTKEGNTYEYLVTTLSEVAPSETDLLQPSEEEVLTLYTCSGFMDSKRFVVRAERVTEQANQDAAF